MPHDQFSDAALIILGHGSTKNDASSAPVYQHAAELRQRNLFAEVREAFWKQEPQIKTVLADISEAKIFIVPLFISEGYFSSEVIPKALGFLPGETTLDTRESTLVLCKPIGTHERMTSVLLFRASEVAAKFPFPRAPHPKDTTLFIAGHGTEQNENSRKAIERQVEIIRATNEYAAVHAVFLEEEPRIGNCYELARTKNIIVVPFFISDGMHAQEDIPVLLGEPERQVKERIANKQPTWRNPTEHHDKFVWYAEPVGTEPHIADVILDRVRESAKLTKRRMSKLRWGILGTANISRKNWKSILHSGHVVTAVASRNARRSREFIEQCQREHPFATAPIALGSYQELIDSPQVDAIYIPIPTALRKDWVVRAAKAGKHVLSEKPCAATVAELREMIDACQRHHVQFMDGVMFMHNPRLARIRRALENHAALGDLKRITSHFSFEAADDFLSANIRSDAALEPLGCLGDLGWYNIRFALWTMHWQLPREVSGRILSQAGRQQDAGQVPFEFSGELIFASGVSSGFYCSFLTTYSNWAIVTGTKGEVRVPDFALPKNSSEGALETNGALADDLVVDPLTAQETNMIRAFSAQVLSGKLNQDWVDWALKTQIVTNACLDAARAGRPVSL